MFWTQPQFGAFILLHELGHQLSAITGFLPDAGPSNLSLNQSQSQQVFGICLGKRAGIDLFKTELWCLSLASVPCSSVRGSRARTARYTGSVTDSEGVAIPRASIHVYWDPSGAAVGLKDNIGVKHELTLLTNQKGELVG